MLIACCEANFFTTPKHYFGKIKAVVLAGNPCHLAEAFVIDCSLC